MTRTIVFSLVLTSVLTVPRLTAQSDSLLPFPARNLILPDVRAVIGRGGDGFSFSYTVRNRAGAAQSIHRILIELKGQSNSLSAPSDWTVWQRDYDTLLVAVWFSSDSLADIEAGEDLTGFRFGNNGLPSINRCWLRAWEMISGSEGQYDPSTAGIFQTSLVRLTVGPRFIADSSDSTLLLDTLLSYVIQSRSLEWISTDGIADKYSGYFNSAKANLQSNNVGAARATLQQVLHDVDIDSSSSLTSEAYALLRYNTEYLLDHVPAGSFVSSYSLFAAHSLWLEQNADVVSGDIGVNETGDAPFLDSQVELSVGIGTSAASGSSIKANRIKVKQGSTVGSDVYYNELENNGTITGTQHTPLTLPLVSTLPEFKTATPGSQNITIPQNGTETLEPGSYGDILVRKSGRLTFTGGTYHLASLNTGDNVQLVFQAPSEIRIAGKFDTDQGAYVGPEDTTSQSANQIVFYIGGINGSNGNLGATPKAAQIGIANTVEANFYVPNGTLWIRQNSQATGAFIGKDVDVGIGVKIWLRSAF